MGGEKNREKGGRRSSYEERGECGVGKCGGKGSGTDLLNRYPLKITVNNLSNNISIRWLTRVPVLNTEGCSDNSHIIKKRRQLLMGTIQENCL